MRLVDTNVILRYLMGDVPAQAHVAHGIIQRIARGEEDAIILHSVVHEVCYALTSSTPGAGYNLTHLDARNRLLPILSLEHIHVLPDKQLCLIALDIFAQGEKMDFTDALQVAYVRGGLSDGIYSFDKRIDRIAGARRVQL